MTGRLGHDDWTVTYSTAMSRNALGCAVQLIVRMDGGISVQTSLRKILLFHRASSYRNGRQEITEQMILTWHRDVLTGRMLVSL